MLLWHSHHLSKKRSGLLFQVLLFSCRMSVEIRCQKVSTSLRRGMLFLANSLKWNEGDSVDGDVNLLSFVTKTLLRESRMCVYYKPHITIFWKIIIGNDVKYSFELATMRRCMDTYTRVGFPWLRVGNKQIFGSRLKCFYLLKLTWILLHET